MTASQTSEAIMSAPSQPSDQTSDSATDTTTKSEPSETPPEPELTITEQPDCNIPPPPPLPGSNIPPPPPMPGCNIPPPPPMPGCNIPPPPPMPGCNIPPPPPMPGCNIPPPPPMPGCNIPPPPPMPGCNIPPPPPMPGCNIPPPPPMPGCNIPPPPPMPGCNIPPPPPMPGMGPPPPPPIPGMGPPQPPLFPGQMCGPPPPPPMSGPAPMPAPPLGGWQMAYNSARKKPVTPSAPMKPLFWNRIQIQVPLKPVSVVSPIMSPDEVDSNDSSESSDISNQSKQKCLWDNIEDTPLTEELINEEFVGLFSRQVIQRKKAKEEEKPKKKTKEVANIIDSKRAHNVGILVTSLHLEMSDIENAVYNFDNSVVDFEKLQQIFEVMATKEELEQINKHLSTKPDIPLAKAEQFLFDLSQIHEFSDRVQCILYEIKFGDQLSTIESRLNNFKMLCQSLTTTTAIKDVFAIILTLGNYMNGGNRDRGQADGFGLEILPKLRDVKGNNSISLLEYVVRTYIKKFFPDVLSLDELRFPLPEPSDLERASAIVFDDIVADINSLEKELISCETKVNKVLKNAQNEQHIHPFEERTKAFIDKAKEQIKDEKENVEECQKRFPETMEFFSYRPKSSKESDWPKEFFANWIPFCSDFKDIFKREVQRTIKQNVEKSKQRLKEMTENKKKEQLTATKKITSGGLKDRLLKQNKKQ